MSVSQEMMRRIVISGLTLMFEFSLVLLSGCEDAQRSEMGEVVDTADERLADVSSVDLGARSERDGMSQADEGSPVESPKPRQVQTTLGTLEGGVHETPHGSVLGFFGVPYAAPPVESLRLRPPQPPQAWADVRDATSFSATCPQGGDLLGALFSDEVPQSEDCLYLNIWTTADPDTELVMGGDPRPVMVWIHGGGFIQGSGSFALYDGARLAARGDVIIITLNYRLGALGFLNSRRLISSAPGSPLDGSLRTLDDARQAGNFGIQDQIAALQWVHDHIERFGGDPNRVTIFGESAGGFSICALLASPSARSLFHRAIIESGGGCRGFEELGEDLSSPVELKANAILGALGCDERSGEELHQCLSARSSEELISANSAASQSLLGLDELGPVSDGQLIRGSARELLGTEGLPDIPVITGSNSDEMTLFTFNQDISLERYELMLSGTFGEDAPALSALYPAETDREARDAYNALWSDLLFICPTLSFAAETSTAVGRGGSPTWVYHFTHALSSGVPALLGATHAIEIPFVFNNTHIELFGASATEEDTALSDHIADTWVSFARDGEPSAWPEWTPYHERRDGDMSQNTTFEGAIGILQVSPEVSRAPLREGRCAELAELGFSNLW